MTYLHLSHLNPFCKGNDSIGFYIMLLFYVFQNIPIFTDGLRGDLTFSFYKIIEFEIISVFNTFNYVVL